MYEKKEYTESHLPTLHTFIKSNPLGILTTALPSSTPLIQSTHLPFILDPENQRGKGKLRSHIARQNPQTKAILDSLSNGNGNGNGMLGSEVMILFTSPVQHYVTPKFYTHAKPLTGKVAPTWNYAAVQVYGSARIYHDLKDPDTDRFLSAQLRDLAAFTEEEIMGFTGESGAKEPWRVGEAPEGYISLLKRKIVGIEVEIERIEGKFKMSQERVLEDREGVIQGFQDLNTSTATQMAGMVRERGEIYDRKQKA